jgi:uncharacterized phage infection (PIP) family protein YhgE
MIFLVMSLAVSPMLRADPKDVPFAALSLDAGAQTPGGIVNMGDGLLAQMTAGMPGVESPIKWSVLSSRTELDSALKNNEYYGALVIPADFSAKQAVAAAGHGMPPKWKSLSTKAKT